MRRVLIASSAAAVLIASSTLAIAAPKGEFNDMCAEGLALHQIVHTNCSVNTTINGKVYCFGNAKARKIFMMHPQENLKRAIAYYKTLPQK